MRINIMKKGEKFIGIQDGWIMLRQKDGAVRLVRIEADEDGYRVIPEKEIHIGYGDGEISIGDMDTGIEVVTF